MSLDRFVNSSSCYDPAGSHAFVGLQQGEREYEDSVSDLVQDSSSCFC